MRRPTDRQATRRIVSGDPREICNQVPSRKAGAFLILLPHRDRQTVEAKAAREHGRERTSMCVSGRRSAATRGSTEMAVAP